MTSVHPTFDTVTQTWFLPTGEEAPTLCKLQQLLGSRVTIEGYFPQGRAVSPAERSGFKKTPTTAADVRVRLELPRAMTIQPRSKPYRAPVQPPPLTTLHQAPLQEPAPASAPVKGGLTRIKPPDARRARKIDYDGVLTDYLAGQLSNREIAVKHRVSSAGEVYNIARTRAQELKIPLNRQPRQPKVLVPKVLIAQIAPSSRSQPLKKKFSKAWPEERVNRLRELAARGLSGRLIALELKEGLSRSAVIAKAINLGIKLQGNKR